MDRLRLAFLATIFAFIGVALVLASHQYELAGIRDRLDALEGRCK